MSDSSPKLGIHYPCPRTVFTGRIYGGPLVTAGINMGRVQGVRNDARVHSPWTRVVCTEL